MKALRPAPAASSSAISALARLRGAHVHTVSHSPRPPSATRTARAGLRPAATPFPAFRRMHFRLGPLGPRRGGRATAAPHLESESESGAVAIRPAGPSPAWARRWRAGGGGLAWWLRTAAALRRAHRLRTRSRHECAAARGPGADPGEAGSHDTAVRRGKQRRGLGLVVSSAGLPRASSARAQAC